MYLVWSILQSLLNSSSSDELLCCYIIASLFFRNETCDGESMILLLGINIDINIYLYIFTLSNFGTFLIEFSSCRKKFIEKNARQICLLFTWSLFSMSQVGSSIIITSLLPHRHLNLAQPCFIFLDRIKIAANQTRIAINMVLRVRADIREAEKR